jgi:hypothetical protein
VGQSWSAVLGGIGFGDQILDRTTDCPVVAHRSSTPGCQGNGPAVDADRVPHVCPRYIMTMIRMHIMHQESPATRAVLRQAQPSQREGQLDDVDYQTAYQSARTVGVNGVGVQSPPQGRSTTQTVDGAQSETATFANGWLTKMIKARLHLQQSGPD